MDNPWEVVKNFNGICFQFIEMNRLNWGDKEKIAELRSMYIAGPRRPRVDQRSTANTSNRAATPQNSLGTFALCAAFQRGECTGNSPHDFNGTLVRHVCGYCLRVTGRAYDHSEKDCIRKSKNYPQQTVQGAVHGAQRQ
jgi:hypothetical protein